MGRERRRDFTFLSPFFSYLFFRVWKRRRFCGPILKGPAVRERERERERLAIDMLMHSSLTQSLSLSLSLSVCPSHTRRQLKSCADAAASTALRVVKTGKKTLCHRRPARWTRFFRKRKRKETKTSARPMAGLGRRPIWRTRSHQNQSKWLISVLFERRVLQDGRRP